MKSFVDILKEKMVEVSYVGESSHLFNDTVKENIVLKRKINSQFDEDFLLDLIKLFALDHLSNSIETVLDLVVGENGKRISGGEGSRIALVRSLLTNSSIYIWDDPFGAVDILQERQIFKKLLSFDQFKNSRFIISTHRQSITKLSDKVILLDKEKLSVVVEEGDYYKRPESSIYKFFSKQIKLLKEKSDGN